MHIVAFVYMVQQIHQLIYLMLHVHESVVHLVISLMLNACLLFGRYARDVEITNGRWAMLGFLAAITVEAATGKGILSQLIYYAKLSGLLGQQSGF